MSLFFEHIEGMASEAGALWMEMGIYLLFGFGVAGVLQQMLRRETVAKHLGDESMGAVLRATLFGIPLPLCSCGVVPVALSLKRQGASRSATTAFLIATPQTGVDSILVTYAFLGPIFAVIRPLAALFNGVLGGVLVTLFDKRPEKIPLSPTSAACDIATGTELPVPTILERVWGAFRYGYLDFPREIVKWLCIGVVLAGVLSYWLPPNLLEHHLGHGLTPMLLAMAIGIPLYICSTASVPVAAVLIAKGLSPGAALVLLMTGPATNAASITVISRALGRRTTTIFLASIAFSSLLCGSLLDAFLLWRGTSISVHIAHHVHGGGAMGALTLAGGVGLALVVAIAFTRNIIEKIHNKRSMTMTDSDAVVFDIPVEGMTCQNCVRHVREAVESVSGVLQAVVSLEDGSVRVEAKSPDTAAIVAAIRKSGYQVPVDRGA
jgi:uncharacterized membrane protein YraQ (UPF0718 family)/copper chaperone CopZ